MNNNYYMDLVHNNFDDNFLQDKICQIFQLMLLLDYSKNQIHLTFLKFPLHVFFDPDRGIV